MSNFSAVWF